MILENLELFNSSRDFVKIKKLTQKIKTKRRRKKKKKEGKKTALPPSLRGGILSLSKESLRYLGRSSCTAGEARSQVRKRGSWPSGVSTEKGETAAKQRRRGVWLAARSRAAASRSEG